MADPVASEQSIFLSAIEMRSSAERAAFLAEACGGDERLRAGVEELLAAHARLGTVDSPAHAPTADPSGVERPGTLIGPYKLLEPIGEGGMGTVWMAEQTEPVRRKVALKLIKAGMDSRQVLARFDAERQALALMDHPNIAKVFDGGTINRSPHAPREGARAPHAEREGYYGRLYFVMELVKGVPITKFCDQHRLTPRQRLELFVPICQAVQHAHQKGIIHRDLKPSNVLVALYDEWPVPKVIDFGVAKATGQQLTEATLHTGFGSVVGTVEYMSPEQASFNQLDVDTRSDIYSLGVLLYELLTGSPPFSKKELEQAGMLETLRMIREQEPTRPSAKLSTSDGLPTLAANRGTEPAKLTRLVRGELDWIVMKALDKNRNRRYETASAFAMDVQRFLANEPVQAGPPSAAYRLRKFARRNRTGVLAASLVMLALTVGLIGTTAGLVRADHHWQRAEQAAEHEREAKVREAEKHRLAEERKQLAEANARQAIEEKRIADAVREFLQTKLLIHADVVTQADSLVHYGGPAVHAHWDVTVRELLDRAAEELAPEKIEANFPDQPEVQAELLATIGATYHGVGETAKAVAFLKRAIELARRHFGRDDLRTLKMQLYLAAGYRQLDNSKEAIGLLEHASRSLEEQLGPDHLDTALAWDNLACAYLYAGRRAEAIGLLERARNVFEKKLSPRHSRTLTTRHNLACANDGIAESVLLFEQVHRDMEAHLGPDHPRTLSALTGLAESYRDAGKLRDAVQLLDRAHKARVQRLGPDHPDTLYTLQHLAAAHLDAGDLSDGIRLSEQVRNALEKKFGSNHPGTLRAMNGLATAYHTIGKLPEAFRLLEQAHRGFEKQLGPDHPNTLTTLHNLAIAYLDDRKPEEAIRRFEQIRDVRTKKSGADHPSTLTTLNFLAEAYLRTGRLPEAIELFESVKKAREEKLGPDHPQTHITINHLARAYEKAERVPEAIQLLERARETQDKQLGADHPITLSTLHHLAGAYLEAERLRDAIPLYEQVRDAREKKLGAEHPDTVTTLNDLAIAYKVAGRYVDAIRQLERVRDVEEKRFGADSPVTLGTINSLGHLNWAAGNRKESIRLFEQARDGREAKLGRDHADTLATLNSLGVCYWRTKQLNKSIPLFEDLLKRQEGKLTREHRDTLATITNLGVNYGDARQFDKAIPLLEEAYRKAKSRADSAWIGRELRIYLDRAGKTPQAVKLVEDEVAAARKDHPPKSSELAAALATAGKDLVELDQYAAAEPFVRESLAIYEKQSPDDGSRWSAMSLLGETLVGQKKYADAEPLLLQSYEGMKRHEEKSGLLLRESRTEALERLVQLYQASGDKAQMAKWQAELEGLKKASASKDK